MRESKCGRCERKSQHPIHSRNQRFAGFDQIVVLLLGNKIRPQERTEKPSASGKLARFHLLL